jgi:hypothetical protein
MDEAGEPGYCAVGHAILSGCESMAFESQSDDCDLRRDRGLSSSFVLRSDDLWIESRRGAAYEAIEC